MIDSFKSYYSFFCMFIEPIKFFFLKESSHKSRYDFRPLNLSSRMVLVYFIVLSPQEVEQTFGKPVENMDSQEEDTQISRKKDDRQIINILIYKAVRILSESKELAKIVRISFTLRVSLTWPKSTSLNIKKSKKIDRYPERQIDIQK